MYTNIYTLLIKTLAGFLILMIPSFSLSQDLTGRVRSEREIALEGVSVLLGDTKKGVLTDAKGYFSLREIPPGTYTLHLSTIGFIRQKIKVVVTEGQTTFVDIQLREDARNLDEIVIEERKNNILINRLPDIHNMSLISGKKNEVVELGGVNGNIAEKTGRQIFAKIPGVFVYDMDGSGNQINISTRGLDPHRSWEFNIRQNNIITNSDMYGYPASHYSPALESIERIEIIRGSSSLQYGAQFGGMINYVTKAPDTTRAFGFEAINTAGSYGLFSSYNAVGGKIGKLTYAAYYQKRHSNGYRKNATSEAASQFASLAYDFNDALSVKVEMGRSSYIYKIPGPLTDAMFEYNPRQSTRSRNYFNPDIYVPSFTINWKIAGSTRLRFTNSGLFGSRNSVMLDAFANVRDSINPATNQYKNRQVDIDNFKSITSEIRIIHPYQVLGKTNFLSAGVQYMHNHLRRRQLGVGTTGSDFDLSVKDNFFGRDLHMRTKNLAFFVENLIYITQKLTLSPGFRIERGSTSMTGTITYYKPENLPNRIKHQFPLFGINSQYRLSASKRIYAGFSQAYRPVVFKDIIPASILEQVDKNLKDARGYNLELGMNGNLGSILTYDLSLFQISYQNRMGTLSLQNELNQSYLLRTNTGNTRTRGLEVYVEYSPFRIKNQSGTVTSLSLFTSTSYFDAEYLKGSVLSDNKNTDIVGNRLEGVPSWISRNGLQFQHKNLFSTLQYSYVSAHFSDPLNTTSPSVNGAKGKVPSYGLWDVNGTLRVRSNYTLKVGMNNIFNRQYFTKRPTMYPGAGIWSSDGRSCVLTFGIKI